MEKCQNEGLIRNHQKIQNLVFNEIGENYDPETHLWDFMKKSEAGDFNLSEPELIDYYSEQEYEYYIPDVNIETFFEYSRSVRFELPSDYNKTYEIVRKRIDEEFWKNFGNKIISSYSKELEQKTERDFKLTNVRKSISDILEDEEKKSCRKSVFAISESEKVADFIRYVRKDGKLEYFKPLIKYYKNIDRSGEFEKLVIMEANDMLPLFDTDPIKYIQGIEK